MKGILAAFVNVRLDTNHFAREASFLSQKLKESCKIMPG